MTQHAPTDLGTRVRNRRLALGLSRAEIAERAGLTVTAIDRIESRPVVLTGGELLRLVHALDSTMTGLIGSPEPRATAAGSAPLTAMPRQECLALLERGGIGRIAYNATGRLTVVPVNFVRSNGVIMFRTAADSTVAQFALEPVAFEVDHFDESTHEGWSVLVNGTLRPATDDESARAAGRVVPWAGGPRDTCMVIEPSQISGRRVG